MRLYSTHRPIDIGTIPKNDAFPIKEIVNFDEPIFVPEIDHDAYGYVEYDEYIPKKLAGEYQLTALEYIIIDTWKKIVHAFDLAREHEKGPAVTAKHLLKTVDNSFLFRTLAAYCKIRSHDGRISDRNRKWLSSVEVRSDVIEWKSGNPVCKAGWDDIHPANLDQIMTELRNLANGWKTYKISFELKTMLPPEAIEEAISDIGSCFHLEDMAKICDAENIEIKPIE